MGRLLLAVMIAALSGLLPLTAVAQSPATPAPQRCPTSAEREFETAGMRLIGPAAILVSVFGCASPAAAAEAFPAMSDAIADHFGGEALQQASAPRLGDERVALAGQTPPDPDGDTFAVGIFAWRDGAYIYLTVAAGLTGEQLPVLFDLARTLEERDATGDVWQRLPALDDMPEGFVVRSEQPIARATPAA
jgi:hypothetical protein